MYRDDNDDVLKQTSCVTYSFEIEYVRDRIHELQITVLSRLVLFL